MVQVQALVYFLALSDRSQCRLCANLALVSLANNLAAFGPMAKAGQTRHSRLRADAVSRLLQHTSSWEPSYEGMTVSA